jgi:YHS domain-containing protein
MASNRGSVPYAGHAARETDRSATNRDAVGRERSAAKPPHAAEQAALALDGYCPILLTDEERWVPGSLRWSLVHQGLRYCFSSPEARQRFLNQPRRYSLVLAGKDIVLMVQEGKQVAGKREFGVWYEGLIFLFSSQETFDRFHENPQYFAKIASRINAPLSQNPPVHRR